MKKLLLAAFIAALFIGMGNDAHAQYKAFKVKPFSSYYNTASVFNYGLGLAFLKSSGGAFAVQHNLDLEFNGINPLFRYKPDFRIYVLDDAPYGLYVNPYMYIGATTGKFGTGNFALRNTVISSGLGVGVGYDYIINDKFSVDAGIGFGWGNFFNINDNGFGGTTTSFINGFDVIPSIGFGFLFE